MMNLDIRNPKAQSSTVTVCDFAKNMMKLKRNDELIPKRLKKLREEKGWSQTQAGDAIGAGRGAWQQWELRKRTPSDTALIAASYIFNVSLPYICGVDDEPTPQSMIIPESRLQPMDRNGIEAYLSLTRQEKEFVRKTMDFLQSHRHQQ